MSKKNNQYLGKAGHLSVMSEFLIRGWNVAIPEVDVGDDIFVVEDEKGLLKRVQVKTSSATLQKNGFSAQFQVSLSQLRNIRDVLIYYVFIIRNDNKWIAPVIISQDVLKNLCETKRVGSKYKDTINLWFGYNLGKITCSKQDFTIYQNDYSKFPIIQH